MADAQGVRSGQNYQEIGVDLTPLERGLREAGNKLKSWGDSVASMGGVSDPRPTERLRPVPAAP